MFPVLPKNLKNSLSGESTKDVSPPIKANAGNQLAHINNVPDILTLKVIISLSALGLLPIITKRIYERFKTKH